jgi:hypothetical protein
MLKFISDLKLLYKLAFPAVMLVIAAAARAETLRAGVDVFLGGIRVS